MIYQKIAGIFIIVFIINSGMSSASENENKPSLLYLKEIIKLGLDPQVVKTDDFHKGITPKNFNERTGADYKPSFNEEPSIPAQCWIETGYGTQNACLYCHTDYLASIGHGNAFPLGEDQILYSFPTPDLNKILWRNTIFPNEIIARLKKEGIEIPDAEDVSYVRWNNWLPAFVKAKREKCGNWVNSASEDFILFPALNPLHLYPYSDKNPTSDGQHGYIDKDGFVRDEKSQITGWRAVNFFPYGIFTPISGSVSGIYLRLPKNFMTDDGILDLGIYNKNLELLEKNIKNHNYRETNYYGDASKIEVTKGFFPLGSEFAHPLHYVDLNADGQSGENLDGVEHVSGLDYEFPGTRSKRLKEMRYMYKWKSVGLEDIGEDAHHEEFVIGHEGRGWVDNNAGWLLSAFIEDRDGLLRPQTTEELMQCIGCHGKVGNTVDSVWSFQRKLPGKAGWREMNYGEYDSSKPQFSRLPDYQRENSDMGELGYFFHVVVGADLYGVMPSEVAKELKTFHTAHRDALDLKLDIDHIFSDAQLQKMGREKRRSHLLERQRIMRAYAKNLGYLYQVEKSNHLFIKGSVLYPSVSTMKANISLYRKIVLDQSFNLGKDVFGTEAGHVPFTFRSDGTVKNSEGKLIPLGEVISSRPYNTEGEGITPTGIVKVNKEGKPIDTEGNEVDIETNAHKAIGHISSGGTFDTMYNPILGDHPLRSVSKN
jgi:hypothetical protein